MSAEIYKITEPNPLEDLLAKVTGQYSAILADPPWQFQIQPQFFKTSIG